MRKRSKQYNDEIDRKVDYDAIKPCPQCGCKDCDMFEWSPKTGHFRSTIICPNCDFELNSPVVDHNQLRRKDADWLFHLETELIDKWNKLKKSRKPKVEKAIPADDPTPAEPVVEESIPNPLPDIEPVERTTTPQQLQFLW